MIENKSEDLVNEKGKRAYIYKRKHNISNDPNKRKVINEEKKQSNNCNNIIIIIATLNFSKFIFWHLFWFKKQKKK
jgi:hypothetical protein